MSSIFRDPVNRLAFATVLVSIAPLAVFVHDAFFVLLLLWPVGVVAGLGALLNIRRGGWLARVCTLGAVLAVLAAPVLVVYDLAPDRDMSARDAGDKLGDSGIRIPDSFGFVGMRRFDCPAMSGDCGYAARYSATADRFSDYQQMFAGGKLAAPQRLTCAELPAGEWPDVHCAGLSEIWKSSADSVLGWSILITQSATSADIWLRRGPR